MARFVIAGDRSGAGKTTVTLALLAALGQRSPRVQAFKVGPDYIDPMFHHYVTGRPSYPLDPILTSPAYLQQSFARHSQTADHVLVEGVMGLFDGATGADDTASTAHIARLLQLPIVLVIDCSRLSRSVGAIAHGYRSLDPRLQIAGVVLNRVGSDRHRELLAAALDSLQMPVLGCLHRQDTITIPDRHLGLIPTAELPHLRPLVDQLAHLGQRCFDWPALESLGAASQGPGVQVLEDGRSPLPGSPRIAVARDAAFSFYYPDSLEILRGLGAELVEWSPLTDGAPPEALQGLYFGGGFPEMFAETLAANRGAIAQVRAAIQAGLPTYGECGGLMYLCDRLIDFSDRPWPMVGILPTTVQMQPRLTLGYRQATALQSSPLLVPGDRIWGHEFHRSEVTTPPRQPLYQLQRYDAPQPHAREGWGQHRVHASYLHLHWGGCPDQARRFVASCAQVSPFGDKTSPR